jgi:hypothetical protein
MYRNSTTGSGGPDILWFMEQAARRPPSCHARSRPYARKSPSSLDRAGGASEAAGRDRPPGRQNSTIAHALALTIGLAERSGTEWECAHYTKVGGQLASDAEHRPTSNGQFADGCDPSEPNWAGRPPFHPRDNLAMLGGGLAKPMRM